MIAVQKGRLGHVQLVERETERVVWPPDSPLVSLVTWRAQGFGQQQAVKRREYAKKHDKLKKLDHLDFGEPHTSSDAKGALMQSAGVPKDQAYAAGEYQYPSLNAIEASRRVDQERATEAGFEASSGRPVGDAGFPSAPPRTDKAKCLMWVKHGNCEKFDQTGW